MEPVISELTESEVHEHLLEWVSRFYPKEFADYNRHIQGLNNDDLKKTFSRELLQFRLRKDPSWMYVLPASLLGKIGIKVERKSIACYPELVSLFGSKGKIVEIIKIENRE